LICPSGNGWWFRHFDPYIVEILFNDENHINTTLDNPNLISVVATAFPFDRMSPSFHLGEEVITKYSQAIELVLCPTSHCENTDIDDLWQGLKRMSPEAPTSALRYISVCGGPADIIDMIRSKQPAQAVMYAVIRYTPCPVRAKNTEQNCKDPLINGQIERSLRARNDVERLVALQMAQFKNEMKCAEQRFATF
jgi:hypothetical protein